jgi:APA family basic amino acid/polyamine antiporter
MTANDGERADLLPVLGPFDVTMIVMGSIIGAGVFFTPSHIAAQAGSLTGILLVWALGGVFAITGALVFAELGAMLPRTGGQYVFIREGFGRFVAFLFGWILLTAIISPAVAFVAGVFTDHVERVGQYLRPELVFGPRARQGISIGLIVALALLNARGVRLGATVQNLSMLAKIAGILLIVLLGAGVLFGVQPKPADVVPGAVHPRSLGGMGVALIGVVFSYGGWQNVTAVASEVRAPQRTLPVGILAGTLGVIVLYLSLNAALVAILGIDGLASSSTPVATAAGAVFSFGEPLVAAMVALSTFAITQALLMVAPRILYAMSRDGLFFKRAAFVHSSWRTPVVAIGTLAAISVAHVFLADELSEALEITTLADAVFFALSAAVLFRLRRTRPDAERPYRAHGYPYLPAIFLLFSAGMVVNAVFNAHEAGVKLVVVLFVTGSLLYAWWRR